LFRDLIFSIFFHKCDFNRTFKNYQHGIEGTVTIHKSCTFKIEGFSYDGNGPDVFFWSAAIGKSLRDDGQQLKAVEKRRFSRECFVENLPTGTTWDDLAEGSGGFQLSVWCRRFSGLSFQLFLFTSNLRLSLYSRVANFGDVTLTKPSAPTTLPIAVCDPSAACNEWIGATGLVFCCVFLRCF
jgi:hypothetical protein